MIDSGLPHTRKTSKLLEEGKREEAISKHNQRVKEEKARAEAGETINLSDLMAAKEEIVVDELDKATGQGRR